MKLRLFISLLLFITVSGRASDGLDFQLNPGYEQRIRSYIDSMRTIDNHEHMYNPELLMSSGSVDFTILLQQNCYDDLVSAGMPNSVFNKLYNSTLTAKEKWKIIEPFWVNTSNTASCRVLLIAIRDLYGINELNDSTVEILSTRRREACKVAWFDHVVLDL